MMISLSVFVCLCVVNLFSSEFSKHLEQDVSRVFQGCYKGVSLVYYVCLKGVPRVF